MEYMASSKRRSWLWLKSKREESLLFVVYLVNKPDVMPKRNGTVSYMELQHSEYMGRCKRGFSYWFSRFFLPNTSREVILYIYLGLLGQLCSYHLHRQCLNMCWWLQLWQENTGLTQAVTCYCSFQKYLYSINKPGSI